MSTAIGNVLIVYGLVAALQFVIGLLGLLVSEHWKDRQDAARLILTAPIWPVVIVRALWLGCKYVIDEADLPKLRNRP